MPKNVTEVRTLASHTLLTEEYGEQILIDLNGEESYLAAIAKLAQQRSPRKLYVIEVTKRGPSSLAYWFKEYDQFLHRFREALRSGASTLMLYAVPPGRHQLAKIHLVQLA